MPLILQVFTILILVHLFTSDSISIAHDSHLFLFLDNAFKVTLFHTQYW